MDYLEYQKYLAHSKGPWKKHKYLSKIGGHYVYSVNKRNSESDDETPEERKRPRSRKRGSATSSGGVKKRGNGLNLAKVGNLVGMPTFIKRKAGAKKVG